MSRSDFDVVTGPAPSRPIAPAAGPAFRPARFRHASRGGGGLGPTAGRPAADPPQPARIWRMQRRKLSLIALAPDRLPRQSETSLFGKRTYITSELPNSLMNWSS